ncbi:hypothetical protein ACK8OR_07380 [Jannaschia sp. KMU-145]|uniref:hypothetical protein n=1 Tax=Jannaschia halovivens TaxID=3388667 RepID=UPI00396B0D6C
MSAIPPKVQGFDLPDTWRRKRIKYVATYNDEALSDDTDDFKEIEYIEISGVSLVGGVENVSSLQFHKAPSRARRVVRGGDTLVSTVRTYLKAIATVREAPDNLIASTGFCVIRPGEEIDAAFLGWVMKSEPIVGEIVARSVGVSYPATNASEVVKLEAPLPDLDTQRRIVGYLDDKTARIDALIEKKRALLDRLAEKRQALITRAVTRGLNPDAPLKDSGIDWLDKVPAHWEVKKLKYLTPKVSVGIVVTPASWYAEEGVLALRGLNIRPMGFNLQETRLISDDGHEFHAKSELREGDLVSVRTGDPGTTAVVTEDLAGSNCVDLVIIRRPAQMVPRYLGWFLNSNVAKVQYQLGSEGALQAHFNVETSKETLIAVPPTAEQSDIVAHLEAALADHDMIVEKIATSVEKLAEYRAALVTAAVTGKIKALLTEAAPKPAKKEAPAAFKRSVLAAYIADTLCDHPTFGRVKFQKLLHLCEAHLEIQEVAGNYHRDAAGPFDTQMMRSVHSQIEKQGWIAPVKGDKGWTYARGEKVDGYRDHFNRYFGDRKEALEDLLALIAPMKTQQAEIVSTAFASWNDLLLEGKTPSDDEIVDLILNDWTESKKAISADRWHSALAWMREKGLTPRGLGEHTKRKS